MSASTVIEEQRNCQSYSYESEHSRRIFIAYRTTKRVLEAIDPKLVSMLEQAIHKHEEIYNCTFPGTS